MKRLRHPATVIAAIALFVALGGSAAAYATGLISGSKIKNHSIPLSKLTKSAIHQLKGASGSPGTVRAYAYVHPGSSPTFDATRTKNFSAVVSPATGIYCLTPSGGVTEAGTAPLVTVEYGNSSGANLSAFWRAHPDGNSCPLETQFEVRTYTFTAGGSNALSAAVAFTIVVP